MTSDTGKWFLNSQKVEQIKHSLSPFNTKGLVSMEMYAYTFSFLKAKTQKRLYDYLIDA